LRQGEFAIFQQGIEIAVIMAGDDHEVRFGAMEVMQGA
jgi:hypothetical protein